LLDEVFNGLDARARKKLQRALERPRGGHDWVLTLHRPKELPANVTHVARIDGGRIVERKTAHSSFSRSRRPRAQRTQLRDVPLSPDSSWLVRISNASIYRDYRAVIRDLTWTLRAGEHWAVLGANGAGKSTLLSLIYGDLHPALGGTIERAGLSVGERIENWKHRVAWVSPELQADHYAAQSIEEVVISGRYSSVGLNEPPTAADRRSARRWLKFFGIAELRDRGPRSVSYGQMRLALLARAMVNNPELLLLDEPCTGLDGDMRAHVLEEIDRLARNGTQIVMAVHDVDDIVPAVRNVLRIRAGKARSEPRLRTR
jgi:molybdate transport system ATP-binding protein